MPIVPQHFDDDVTGLVCYRFAALGLFVSACAYGDNCEAEAFRCFFLVFF